MSKSKNQDSQSEFIIFKTGDGKVSVDVRMEENDVWLTQDQLALLYQVERPGITQHIKNIFGEGELDENSVSKKFLRTAADGKNYQAKTLSEVEKNYLESLKQIERKTKKKK
jgi:hypothetical protein